VPVVVREGLRSTYERDKGKGPYKGKCPWAEFVTTLLEHTQTATFFGPNSFKKNAKNGGY
jgi:hypothetical protein